MWRGASSPVSRKCDMYSAFRKGLQWKKRATFLKESRDLSRKVANGVLKIQACVRGVSGRKRFQRIKRLYQLQLMKGAMANKIQSFRYKDREFVRNRRRLVRCKQIQRNFRGYLGRKSARSEKDRLVLIKMKLRAASLIQSSWRMKVAVEEFRSMRIHVIAAKELQRI